MRAVTVGGEQTWVCPNCSTVARVPVESETGAPIGGVRTRFHSCPGLAGITAPMVPAGVRCKVEAVEREDWVGNEIVQTNADGRPVMAVVTVRDDGKDCAVLAPLAQRVITRGEMDVIRR